MSYDLYLRDPVTHETLIVSAHMMYGGNILCNVINGELIPAPTTEAYLNITYNYAHYYYEAFPAPGDEAFINQHESDEKQFGLISDKGGIHSLNGMSGLKAIPVLNEMISRIESRYKKTDGSWQVSPREESYIIQKNTGSRIDNISFWEIRCKYRNSGYSEDEINRLIDKNYEEKTEIVHVDEGSDGGSYWVSTAANAIRPLYQLIALSQMRPDGIWKVES